MSTVLKIGHFFMPANAKNWDDMTPTPEHADNFAAIQLNETPLATINDIRYSAEYILANSTETLNEHICKGYDLPEDREIAAMVADHTCRNDIVLYRGVSATSLRSMMSNARTIQGVDLYDQGYSICSIVRGYEDSSDYHLRILVPADSEVVYVGNLNPEHRYAAVLHSGIGLKVVSRDKLYINCKLVW